MQTWGVGGGGVIFNNCWKMYGGGIWWGEKLSRWVELTHEIKYWRGKDKQIRENKEIEWKFSNVGFVGSILGGIEKRGWCGKVGVGVGIHFFTNKVKEVRKEGRWVITDYYAVNDNPVSIEWKVKVGRRVKSKQIIIEWNEGILFILDKRENIFFERENLKEKEIRVSVEFN